MVEPYVDVLATCRYRIAFGNRFRRGIIHHNIGCIKLHFAQPRALVNELPEQLSQPSHLLGALRQGYVLRLSSQ